MYICIGCEGVLSHIVPDIAVVHYGDGQPPNQYQHMLSLSPSFSPQLGPIKLVNTLCSGG